jgi:ribosomal protein S6
VTEVNNTPSTEQAKRTYEGLFLLDAGNPDFDAASQPVRGILDRREAEVLALKPWDERRLAYPIRGRKRGLYVLTYFRVSPDQIDEIEHDCRLDERILRSMILRRDHATAEQIEAETPATADIRKAAERRARRQQREQSQQREQQAGAEKSGQAAEQPPAEPAAEQRGKPEASEGGRESAAADEPPASAPAEPAEAQASAGPQEQPQPQPPAEPAADKENA